MRQPKGQNFLIDKEIAQKIVLSAGLNSEDTVIEIGPGKGILTELIAPKVKALEVVELDSKLAAMLAGNYAACPNVNIITRDFLAYDLPASFSDVKFISNLPYYLATKIIETILPGKKWRKAIFMVQKEVGERIVSPKDRRSYGYFSILCQYYADCRILFKCGPGAFSPKPKVESVVLELINKYPPLVDESLFKVIKLAFGQRRKTILNSLSNVIGCEKPLILDVLLKAKIDPFLRPENLSVESFLDLTFLLKKCIILK